MTPTEAAHLAARLTPSERATLMHALALVGDLDLHPPPAPGPGRAERLVLHDVRLACASLAVLWRNNTGEAVFGGCSYCGHPCACRAPCKCASRAPSLTRVPYGVGGPGGADLIGFRRGDGRFVAVETKAHAGQGMRAGKPSVEQVAFLDGVRAEGGLAGVAWSDTDALAIVRGE